MYILTKKIIALTLLITIIITSCISISAFADEKEFSITSTTPADGTSMVMPMGVKMQVNFNMSVDPTTLSTATITSDPAEIATIVPDPVVPSRCTIYFNALSLDTEYKVVFSKQVRSVDGDKLQKTTVTFKTTADYPKHHQIVNGDMEDTTHLNMFELANAPKKVISYASDDGNNVLKFDPGWAGAGVGQAVYIEPGKTYEIRARIKSTTAQTVRVIMSYVTLSEGSASWWHPIVTKNLQADNWTEYAGTVTIPADLSYDYSRLVRITAQNKNEVIFIDDFQFYEAGFDVPIPEISNNSKHELTTYVSQDENEVLDKMIGLEIFNSNVLKKADSYVTRIDAAAAIGKILGINDMSGNETAFKDLVGVKYRGSAQALTELGILNGYGEYFYPNNCISYQNLLQGMINLLGYNIMTEQSSTEAVVSQMKLDKNVVFDKAGITYKNFAVLLSNVLESEVMEYQSGRYNVDTGKILLWDTMGIEKRKGIITATEYTDIYGGGRAEDNHIVIDGVSYKVTCDTIGWEGKQINFYTKEENDEQIIVFVSGLYSLNDTLVLNWNDIESCTSDGYEYYIDNRKFTADFENDKKLIYNGRALDSYTEADMKITYGSVTLVDNNCNGIYDIICVEQLDTYLVHAINYNDLTIYDENETKTLSLSDANKIVVLQNGEVKSFGNIISGSVVSAAKSKDGLFAKLYLSNNTVEGTVGATSNDGNMKILALYDEIHGGSVSEEIKLHPLYAGVKKARDEGNSFLGQNVTAVLDNNGYAVSIILGSGSDWKWAYLVKAYLDNKNLDEKLDLKLFVEGGEMLVYSCDDKIIVNGSVVKKPDAVLSAINGGIDGVSPQLLKIKVSNANVIKEIISNYDRKERITKQSGSNYVYVSGLRTLGYKISVTDTSTPVFSVPTQVEGAEDSMFVYSTASQYLVNDKKYTFEAYSDDDNAMNAEAVVIKDRNVRNPDSWNIGVVAEINRTIDENGEEIIKIIVRNTASNYNAVVYPNRVDINNLSGMNSGTGLKLELGDVVAYQNDAKTIVYKMNILYSRKNNVLYTSGTPSSSSTTAYRAVCGKIVSQKGDYAQILPVGEADETASYETYNLSVYSRVLGVENDGKVYIASKSDIFDKNCGVDAKSAVVVSSWGGATLFVIY